LDRVDSGKAEEIRPFEMIERQVRRIVESNVENECDEFPATSERSVSSGRHRFVQPSFKRSSECGG
jgi:hypothetical protein